MGYGQFHWENLRQQMSCDAIDMLGMFVKMRRVLDEMSPY